MKKLIRSLKILLELIIKMFEKLVPTNEKVVLFSGIKSRTYSDNTMHLFLYMNEHVTDFSPIWVTKKRSLIPLIKSTSKSNNVVYAYNLKALWYYFRAKFMIITHNSNDFRGFPIENKEVINLWHGIPLKSLRNKVKKFKAKGLNEENSRLLSDYKKYSCLISNSDEESEILEKCFGVDIKDIYPLGMPRNDNLFKKKFNSLNKSYNSEILNDKVILYAPTYREDEDQVELFPFLDRNLVELHEFLEVNNIWLLIRGHGFDGDIYQLFNSDNKFPRFIFADQNTFFDTNTLLPYVDILITDYSSIFFDYTILDRPIIFMPYDLEQYRKIRGFMLNYEEVTPGPKIYTQKDFIETIQRYFDDPTWFGDKRKEVRDRFFKFQDGNACERIYNLMKEKAGF